MSYQYTNSIETPDILSMSESSRSRSNPESLNFGQQTLPEFVRAFASDDDNIVLSRDSLRNMFGTLEKAELMELLILSVMHSTDVRSMVGYTLSNMTTYRRLLVRNISFNSTTDDVKNLLSQYGMIEEGSVVYDRASGKSKGFAFMTFATVESACNAIIDSNSGLIELAGRPLLLKFAADRVDAINTNSKVESVVDASSLTPVSPAKSTTSTRRVFLSGLSAETTSESLAKVMCRLGDMDECFVVTGPNGISRRFAFVTFTSEDAFWACLRQQNLVDGTMVSVQPANENQKKSTPAPKPEVVQVPDLSEVKNLFSSLLLSSGLDSSIEGLWGN